MDIYVNNIKVPFGGTISLKFQNPLFSDTGSYSFPVTFPALPVTQKAFGFPGKAEAEVRKDIPALIRANGIELTGTWEVINTVENKYIEAYFRGGTGSFYHSVAKKYLTDLYYNGTTQPEGFAATRETILTYMSGLMEASALTSDYTAYSAYMPNAMGENTDADIQMVNPVLGTFDIAFILPASGKLNSTVYLFVGVVLDYIFKEHGYIVDKNIFKTDAELRYLTIFNTYNQNAYWEFNYKNFLPKRTINEFLKKLQARFNVGFFINENTRRVVIDSFDNVAASILNTRLKLSEVKNDPRRVSGIKLSAEFVDAWTQNKYETIAQFPGDVDNITEVDTIRDVPVGAGTVGNIYRVRNEQCYYTVKATGSSTYEAQRLCSGQMNFYVGSNHTDFEQAGGSPGMYNLVQDISYNGGTVHRNILLPRCDLECNFRVSAFDWLTRDPAEFKDFPIMFLFSRGRHWDYIDDEQASLIYVRRYPLGSTGVYTAEGEKIESANIELTWDGEYGLTKNLWKNRLNWELNQKKTIRAKVSDNGSGIRDLLEFNRALNIEKSNYLVTSVDLELDVKRTVVDGVELLRL